MNFLPEDENSSISEIAEVQPLYPTSKKIDEVYHSNSQNSNNNKNTLYGDDKAQRDPQFEKPAAAVRKISTRIITSEVIINLEKMAWS